MNAFIILDIYPKYRNQNKKQFINILQQNKQLKIDYKTLQEDKIIKYHAEKNCIKLFEVITTKTLKIDSDK